MKESKKVIHPVELTPKNLELATARADELGLTLDEFIMLLVDDELETRRLTTIAIDVEPELYAELNAIAEREGWTFNQTIVSIVESELPKLKARMLREREEGEE